MSATLTKWRNRGFRGERGSPAGKGVGPAVEAQELYSLDGTSVLSFDPAGEALVVRCESGVVWVTQEGDERDVVIHAGEEFVSAPEGRIAVQALEETQVAVERR